jgi:hypothetical protein
MQKKKVVILNHNGGRLANQLWPFMSAYAYCLENGYILDNQSFFEYAPFFNFKSDNFLVNLLFFKLYNYIKFLLPLKIRGKFYRFIYKIYCYYVKKVESNKRNIVIYAPDSADPIVHFLLPTKNSDIDLDEFESSRDQSKVYLDGWLFRNPIGLNKYHKEIVDYFKPKPSIEKKVKDLIFSLKNKYKYVIGVHVRQGDYKTWMDGKLYFSQDKIKLFLDDLILNFQLNKDETVFLLCSDGQIDDSVFLGLNIAHSIGGVAEDLFVLACSDLIIGSDSTFGAFASYYGNIPFIVFGEEIDWDYYKDKKEYFENKYNKMVYYK